MRKLMFYRTKTAFPPIPSMFLLLTYGRIGRNAHAIKHLNLHTQESSINVRPH